MKNSNCLFTLLAGLTLMALPAYSTSLTTNFTGTNGFTGNMFSAALLKSLTVTSLDVNISAGSSVIDVYEKLGSYVGFETSPAAWTLESESTVTGSGQGLSTPVKVTPFSLLAGNTYSLYITIGAATTGITMFYSNGDSSYSNADLALTLGEGIGGQFGSSGVFPARSWNGTVTYNLASSVATPEPKSLALFGSGLMFLGFVCQRLRTQFRGFDFRRFVRYN